MFPPAPAPSLLFSNPTLNSSNLGETDHRGAWHQEEARDPDLANQSCFNLCRKRLVTQSEPIRVSPETSAVTAGKELSPSSWHQVQPVEYKSVAMVGIPAVCGRQRRQLPPRGIRAVKGDSLLNCWSSESSFPTVYCHCTLHPKICWLTAAPIHLLWACILSKSFLCSSGYLAGAGVSKMALLACQHQEEWAWLEYLGLARPLSQSGYVYIFKQNSFIFHSLPSSRDPLCLLG